MLVLPSLPVRVALVEQTRDVSPHTFHFFGRFVLVAGVRDRKKAKPRAAERTVSVEGLACALRTGREPPLVENLRYESADIRVQSPCFSNKDTLLAADRGSAIQQVPKSGNLRAGRMDALLGLVELLRIAEQDDARRGRRQGQHISK